MDRPRRIALLLVLAVVLAACGAPADSAETVGPAGADGSSGSDSTATTDGSGTTEGSDTTEGAGDGELAIDGGTSAEGTVSGTDVTTHEVVVPDGVRALITVTPGDDYDIVAVANGDTADDGLSGDPETIQITGPTTFTLDVHGYYDDAAGPYTVTIEAA